MKPTNSYVLLFVALLWLTPNDAVAQQVHEEHPYEDDQTPGQDEDDDQQYDQQYDQHFDDKSVEESVDVFETPIEWRFSTGLMSVNDGVNAELEFCGTGEILFTCFGAQALGTNEVLDFTLQIGMQFGTENLRFYFSPGVSLIPAAGFIIDVFAIIGGDYPPFDFYYPSAQLFGEAEAWWKGMQTDKYTLWIGAGASYHLSEFNVNRMPLGAAFNMKVGLAF